MTANAIFYKLESEDRSKGKGIYDLYENKIEKYLPEFKPVIEYLNKNSKNKKNYINDFDILFALRKYFLEYFEKHEELKVTFKNVYEAIRDAIDDYDLFEEVMYEDLSFPPNYEKINFVDYLLEYSNIAFEIFFNCFYDLTKSNDVINFTLLEINNLSNFEYKEVCFAIYKNELFRFIFRNIDLDK